MLESRSNNRHLCRSGIQDLTVENLTKRTRITTPALRSSTSCGNSRPPKYHAGYSKRHGKSVLYVKNGWKILKMPALVKFFHLYMSKVNGPSASSRIKSGHTMANFTGFSAQGVQGSSKRYCKRNLRFWIWYGKWKTLEQQFVSLKLSWGFSNWSIIKKNKWTPINLHLPKKDVSSPTHASPTWTDNFLTPNRHKVIWSATPLSGKSMCPPS